jgi:hypothetical protein
MNLRKISVLAVATLAVLGSAAAEARPYGRHYGGGRALFYAAPIIAGAYLASRAYYRPYYYPPTYYYPPAYYPSTPPVYIEQPQDYSAPQPQYYAPPPQQNYAPQQQEPQYSVPPQSQAQPQSQSQGWYFCAESQGYYPNVQTCPGGWQRQEPQR